MKFFAYGHREIRANHETTFEFTKDDFVTWKGNCICGIKSTFDKKELQKVGEKVGAEGKLLIKITADGVVEEIIADYNEFYDDDHEFVVRKSDFLDNRTLAFNTNKASIDFSDEFREKAKDPKMKIEIEVVPYEETA
jgi:uncharacterized protein